MCGCILELLPCVAKRLQHPDDLVVRSCSKMAKPGERHDATLRDQPDVNCSLLSLAWPGAASFAAYPASVEAACRLDVAFFDKLAQIKKPHPLHLNPPVDKPHAGTCNLLTRLALKLAAASIASDHAHHVTRTQAGTWRPSTGEMARAMGQPHSCSAQPALQPTPPSRRPALHSKTLACPPSSPRSPP